MFANAAYRTGNFDFNEETKKIIDESVRIHKSRNRHHPEFHKNTSERPMSQTDLYEMVADWAAISQVALYDRVLILSSLFILFSGAIWGRVGFSERIL